jgi:hypothetical protein
MLKSLCARAAVGIAVGVALPAAAMSQAGWAPGNELLGQPIQVTTNGTTNVVTISPGGTAQIATPNGNVIPATWQASAGQMCLSAAGGQECWPYNGPFQPGQAQTLTSSCNATSTWLAQSTNQPPGQRAKGERGR